MWYRLVCMREKEKAKETINNDDKYMAKLEIYTSMAHYVGKILHIRPSEILDTWGVPELIVAYGEYANEQSLKNYNEWKALDAKHRGQQPKKYQVMFI